MNIIAKTDPQISLRDHLTMVCTKAEEQLTPIRLNVFQRLGVMEEEARALTQQTAWLHDFGKATAEWQEAIGQKRRPPQHALTSFIASLWANGINNVDDSPVNELASALAILAHHGQLCSASWSRDRYRSQQIEICKEAWMALAEEKGLSCDVKKLPERIMADKICGRVEYAKSRIGQMGNQERFRAIFCLLLTMLVEADHRASAEHERNAGIRDNGPVETGRRAPGSRIIQLSPLTPPHIPGEKTPFQNQVQAHPANLLGAMASCGSGKTAAALLRAAELASYHQVDRIIFCLPTRFTSNSMLRDMTDPAKYNYKENDAALIHSEALHLLREMSGNRKEEEEETDGGSNPEEQASQRWGIRYEHAITISTIDHLLMSLYHGYKFSDRAFGNILSSLVVFDEVQAYDATTLNAMREGMELLHDHQIPTLLMSATLPSSRRKFFSLEEAKMVEETGNENRPFRMFPLQEPLTSAKRVTTETESGARALLREAAGLKLAIYVNQIERAKALARAARIELPGSLVICYHSELAPRDRRKLEEKALASFKGGEPVVLVATQAAELSLDISADRMITELAPADILIQRAGRLHRRGRTPEENGFQYTFLVAPLYEESADEKERKGVSLPYEDRELLQRTWDEAPWGIPFSFEAAARWCETALNAAPTIRDCGLKQAFRHDTVFGRAPEDNYNDEDGSLVIRDRDSVIMHVVPECYLGELPEDIAKISEFLVPLRSGKYWTIHNLGFITTEQKKITFWKGKLKKERIIPLRIVRSNLAYDAEKEGFDFSRIRMDEEMEPSALRDQFL